VGLLDNCSFGIVALSTFLPNCLTICELLCVWDVEVVNIVTLGSIR